MSVAGSYSFKIQRGANDSRLLTVKSNGVAINLTGWTPRLQIRSEEGATGVTTDDTLLLEMTPANGLVITDAVDGEITLAFTPEQTQTINPANEYARLSYGLEIFTTSPAFVRSLLTGTITVVPEVVR